MDMVAVLEDTMAFCCALRHIKCLQSEKTFPWNVQLEKPYMLLIWFVIVV
jgi:hypothetical protein